MIETEIPRLNRSATGNIDRRVRLLDWLWPAVDIAELIELAIERENILLGPRPHDEFVSFRILCPGQSWNLAVGEVRVHGRADRKSCDETTTGDAVEHGELFGNADRWVVQRDRVADDADRRFARAAGQRGSDDVGAWHQAVAVLVVLVAADAIEAHGFGKLELVEIGVVHPVGFFWVEQGAWNVDPDRTVFLLEVVAQVRPRHQIEPDELHVRAPRVARLATA